MTPERGSDGTQEGWRALARHAVTTAADGKSTSEDLATRVRQVREDVPRIASQITTRIQAQVPTYAGRGNLPAAIERAVERAAHQFLDALDGEPHRDRGVDDALRGIGQDEAARRTSLTPFHAALRVATTAGWEHVRALASTPGTESTRAELADTFLAFMDHLAEEAERGFTAARRTSGSELGSARVRLAETLLSGEVPEDDATEGVWEIPEWIVVATTDPAERTPAQLASLARSALVVRGGGRFIAIANAQQQAEAVRILSSSGSRVAVSWPVKAHAVAAAHRWTRRALQLVDRGILPAEKVVDCRDHRTQIWLHSEPELRQRLCQELLKPLLAETPNSREILSETLLVWLETRDSAPMIAARLDVHPQTVRYRWRRINELFGEDLHDPAFILQITMLLKASVPLWKAGDQSDFERFVTERDG